MTAATIVHPLVLLVSAAPIALVAVDLMSVRHRAPRPKGLIRLALVAGIVSLLVPLAALAAVIAQGPMASPVLGIGEFGLSFRLDLLSTIMASLVGFIGLIVINFSRNYLDGEARQGAFLGALATMVALVQMLVLSGNLAQLLVAFIAMSLGFNRLLVHYADRPAALLVARKKFVVARFADVSLALAVLLLYLAFGTADISQIMVAAKTGMQGETSTYAQAAAVLLALAAMQKSAQLPFHFWLPEVMETPTPVSALLHAGIINAGGFLVIRFADVMVLSPLSLTLLAAVGLVTALFAGLVMMTQTTAKGTLAWSTIAQMGFMLFQCGLGLFHLALLHILAHSVYKAHAFLSAGSVVAQSAKRPASGPANRPGPGLIVVSLVLTATLYLAISHAFGLGPDKHPALFTAGAIFVLGLAHLPAAGLAGPRDSVRIGLVMAMAAGLTASYVALSGLATLAFGTVLPAAPPANAASLAIMALAIAAFALAAGLQMAGLERLSGPRAIRVWTHLHNGFYINAWINRHLARN